MAVSLAQIQKDDELRFARTSGLIGAGSPFSIPSISIPFDGLPRSRKALPLLLGTVFSAFFLSEYALAAVIRVASSHANYIDSRLDERLGKTLVDRSGSEYFFNVSNDPNVPLSLRIDPKFEKGTPLGLYKGLLTFTEDRSLGKPLSLRRYAGIDLAALGKSTIQVFVKSDPRGASTLPMQLCSVEYSSFNVRKNLRGFARKANEIWCAVKLDAQVKGNHNRIIELAANHLPTVVGQRGSNWGTPVHGIELGAQVVFGKTSSQLNDCEVAYLMASHKKQVMISGDNPDNSAASAGHESVMTRAKNKLSAYSQHEGRDTSRDAACWAKLQHPEADGEEVTHPSRVIVNATGSSLSALKREARTIDSVVYKTQLDLKSLAQRKQKMLERLCSIDARRPHFKNLCYKKGPIQAQFNLIIGDLNGNIVTHYSFGPAANSALSTPPKEAAINSKGSIQKAVLLPLAKGRDVLCRIDVPGLRDPDKVKGGKGCSKETNVSVRDVYKKSLNQPELYLLNTTDSHKLRSLIAELGFGVDTKNIELVLGTKSLSISDLMAAYTAQVNTMYGNPPIARKPHFIESVLKGQTNLSNFLEVSDGKWLLDILSAPLERGGTAYGFGRVAKRNGISVITAKTGTSEANDTDERGKHIIGHFEDHSGKPKIFFIEIASPDSSALTISGGIPTSDLAYLLAAAVK